MRTRRQASPASVAAQAFRSQSDQSRSARQASPATPAPDLQSDRDWPRRPPDSGTRLADSPIVAAGVRGVQMPR